MGREIKTKTGDDNDTDEKNISENNWKKINEASLKEGFREGVSQGSEAALQEGFDDGYRAAFSIAMYFSKYKGHIAAKQLNLTEDSQEYSKWGEVVRNVEKLQEDAINHAKNNLRNGLAFNLDAYIADKQLSTQLDEIIKN